MSTSANGCSAKKTMYLTDRVDPYSPRFQKQKKQASPSIFGASLNVLRSDVPADLGKELVKRICFAHGSIRAASHGFRGQILLEFSAEHNNGHLRVISFEMFQQIEAVFTVQIHIQYCQVESLAFQ